MVYSQNNYKDVEMKWADAYKNHNLISFLLQIGCYFTLIP